MKQKIYDILKAKVLLSANASKNWSILLFLFFLSMIMITSAHNAERKIHKIAFKNKTLKEFRSRFVEGRSKLMLLEMESRLENKLKSRGISSPDTPPLKIIVK